MSQVASESPHPAALLCPAPQHSAVAPPQQLAPEGPWSLHSCATSTASHAGEHYSPFCWGCPEILVNP